MVKCADFFQKKILVFLLLGSEGITSSYDPNAVIQSRINVCSDINEHEHSPHCEEALPVCDFSSKYRFVFSKSYNQN